MRSLNEVVQWCAASGYGWLWAAIMGAYVGTKVAYLSYFIGPRLAEKRMTRGLVIFFYLVAVCMAVLGLVVAYVALNLNVAAAAIGGSTGFAVIGWLRSQMRVVEPGHRRPLHDTDEDEDFDNRGDPY